AQRRAGAIAALPVATRSANALLSYVAYLGSTVWPHDLAVFYPPRESFPAWRVVGAAFLLGGVTVGAIAAARRAPWFTVGWLWYLVTLLPVAGFIRAGDQAMADRFTYIPHVGLFVAIVWSCSARMLVPAAAALAGFVVGTRLQLHHWRDSEALFGHALAVTDRNAVADTNYGFVLLDRGRLAEALEHFERAVAIEPWYAKAWVNLGLGLAALGRSDDAIARYRDAIRLDPTFAPAHYDLALELSEHGRLDEAIAEFREALRLDPGRAKTENGLGLALARSGRLDEAVGHYQAALAIDPRLVAVHNNLAVVFEDLGRVDEAIAHYREAVRLVPDEVRAHFNLGAALGDAHRFDEAASEYREVLRRRPDMLDAHLALGDVLLDQGRDADAIAEYRAALASRPGWDAAESRLAWALATSAGDPAEAVRLAEHARRATDGRDPEVLRSLAAAYATAGRFRDAADVARLALAQARRAGLDGLASDLDRHLVAYDAGRRIRRTD
ncbi:MAG TPA: tetratricopeptide repeat protein, partial [Candidatus Binatia bacterium]|nr:tetratricopeptide repeat protein [Candidatus Binatia bacterium]